MKTFFLIILMMIIFLYYENNALTISKYKYTSPKLPPSFDKFRIVHLSDLHCKEFGRDNHILLSHINRLKPDLICITGDLINYYSQDENSTLELVINLKKLAPVYYVTGNHEASNVNFDLLEIKLIEKGIKVLRNSVQELRKNGQVIHLVGIDDPIVTSRAENNYARKIISNELKQVLEECDSSAFKILLTHRAEQFDLYAEHNFDLIFAGHTHGGQIRLPFIGGLIAPGQGYFPEITKGKYYSPRSTMIVSSGLGNASIPQRIFNLPEIVFADLKAIE